MSLPVPDRLALKLATFVPGKVQKILKSPKSWSLIKGSERGTQYYELFNVLYFRTTSQKI